MGRLIGELDAVDPAGETFRYDIDTNGVVHDLPEELGRVDLRQVQSVCRKVLARHNGTADQIQGARDYSLQTLPVGDRPQCCDTSR